MLRMQWLIYPIKSLLKSLKHKIIFFYFLKIKSKQVICLDVLYYMMNDLLKIQSELDRRPKQMKPENKNSQIKEEELISGIIEPNPYLASPRLFGPKCSTHEWLGGFRAFQLQNESMGKL